MFLKALKNIQVQFSARGKKLSFRSRLRYSTNSFLRGQVVEQRKNFFSFFLANFDLGLKNIFVGNFYLGKKFV
jgi:hypothetical protein